MDLEEKIALNIAKSLSDHLCKKITSKTIRWMQGFPTTLDMGYLKNLWDDVCYEIQGEESYSWSYYNDMIISNVASLLEGQEDYEVNAIWMQSDEFYYQLSELESDGILKDSQYEPINLSCYIHDISRYITEEYIYQQAESWRNDRLRQVLGYFPGD